MIICAVHMLHLLQKINEAGAYDNDIEAKLKRLLKNLNILAVGKLG